ncbi:response regulator transcription factor [Dehalococcoides sp. THU3]|uniref:response regulator transcription factor n=1 Tax=Dehalococcoides TaxID=61434 RepID=UPI0005B5676E|nr:MULTISPECIES: response regulator transcription factor [Dehalococcoides]QYY58580.1 response regulator transcription factor [Dehalococcoides mccartyi]BAQ34037.1 putative response regulator [Dehalococcoides sp. UCH007]BEL00366.1 vancomycin resistance response regulator transcription factor VanR-I [Dehalococcoides mccartyi]
MKLVVVDPDQNATEYFKLSLKASNPEDSVLSVDTGNEALDMLENQFPDLLISELTLNDMDGFQLIKQVRLFSHIPIIILTLIHDESSIIKALMLGADEYLVKPVRPLELIARTRAIIRNRQKNNNDISLSAGPFYLETSKLSLKYNRRNISLTHTECQILGKLMDEFKHPVTYSSLANEIWGDELDTARCCLRVYIRRLRRKLEADPDKPRLIRTIVGIGYALYES